MWTYITPNELYHHGILGQKWGVRRYQNKDGSLTKAGLKRYGSSENFERVQTAKKISEAYNSKTAKKARKQEEETEKEIRKYLSKVKTDDERAAEKELEAEKERVKELEAAARKEKTQAMVREYGGKILNKALDAAVEVGGDYLKKELKEAAGLNEQKSELQRWQDKANLAKAKKEVAEYELAEKKARGGDDMSELKIKAERAGYLTTIKKYEDSVATNSKNKAEWETEKYREAYWLSKANADAAEKAYHEGVKKTSDVKINSDTAKSYSDTGKVVLNTYSDEILPGWRMNKYKP